MDRGFQSFYVKVKAPCNGTFEAKKEGWMSPGDTWQI
jgi:hypothetical protein